MTDPYVLRIPLRFDDLDMVGHVNNARYPVFLEDARIGFLRAIGAPFGGGLIRVLARIEVDFKIPVLLEHEAVDISVVVERVGTRSFTLSHDICVGAAVHAQARCVMVTFDANRECSRDLSPDERGPLEALLPA